MKNIVLLSFIIALLFSGCADKQAINGGNMKNQSMFRLSSPAYLGGAQYPDKYACVGLGISPPLEFSGIPEGAKSLSLVLEDPDAPDGTYVHWIMWNIPLVSRIREDSVPEGALQGVNTAGTNRYESPCPPYGTHRYIFSAYALDTVLSLSPEAERIDLDKAMNGHVLASAAFIGLRSKK